MCCYCCSVAKLYVTLCALVDCSMQFSLCVTISQNLLKFIFIESVMLSHHLILCHVLLILPSVFPSMRVFSNESALFIRWPKYWSFSFNISPSKEYSELSSFRIDLFDLLAVQGTLKSLLQHSSKASVFGAQPSLSNSHICTVTPPYSKAPFSLTWTVTVAS